MKFLKDLMAKIGLTPQTTATHVPPAAETAPPSDPPAAPDQAPSE